MSSFLLKTRQGSIVLVTAAVDGVRDWSDKMRCSRSGGRQRKPGQMELFALPSRDKTCGADKRSLKGGDAPKHTASNQPTTAFKTAGKSTPDHDSSSSSLDYVSGGIFLSCQTTRKPPSPSAFFLLAVPTSSRLALALAASPASPVDRESRWSSHCCSPHLVLSPCKREVTRTPTEMSSDGVRAEVGVKSGLHLWELLWSPGHRGSHAVIGVSALDCPLQASGYSVLVGGDSQSWGWELVSNQLWHSGKMLEHYPGKEKRNPSKNADSLGPELFSSSNRKESEAPLLIPERILLVLDADAGTLGFVVDENFLGVAFKDLPRGVELFPAVSSVRGGARIQLRYLNGSTCEPPPLMALCGLSIRRVLGKQEQTHVEKLPLPPYLQHHLLHSY